MEQNPSNKTTFDCVVWDCKKCGRKHTTKSNQVGVCQDSEGARVEGAREYVDTKQNPSKEMTFDEFCKKFFTEEFLELARQEYDKTKASIKQPQPEDEFNVWEKS